MIDSKTVDTGADAGKDASRQAWEMRKEGFTFSQIGRAQGISRQAAQARVNAFAQREFSQPPNPSDLASPKYPLSEPAGGEVPMSVGVRKGIDTEAVIGGRNLSGLATIIREAIQGGDSRPLYRLFRELILRDSNYRSVREIRINQVSSLPMRVTPGGKLARDKKVAEFVEQQLKGMAFQRAVPMLLEAVFDDVSVCPFVLEKGAERWTVADVGHLENWQLGFSKKDGRGLYVAPYTEGAQAVPIDPRGVLVHYARSAGQVVGSGLAIAAAWLYVLKWLAIRDWASLCAVYGKPVKLGKFKPGTPPAEVRALRNAVAQLGSEAAAVIADTMVIEFLQGNTATASAEMFERFIRYCDESLAKLVLGASLTTGTSNTGSGGSQALGVVHAELRADIMRADAKALGYNIAPFVKLLVAVNFGEDVPVPTVEWVIEEPEDVQALAEVAKKAQELGLPLSKAGIAARLNLPLADPEDPEDLLVPAAAPAAASGSPDDAEDEGEDGQGLSAAGRPTARQLFARAGQQSARTEDQPEGPPDAIDDLADESEREWDSATESLREGLQRIARSSRSAEEFAAAAAEFVKTANVDDLALLLAKQATKAGLLGSEIDPTGGA